MTAVADLRSSWVDAPALAARLRRIARAAECDCYRIGDGYLEVRSLDVAFRSRLSMLYHECRVSDRPADALPTVECDVRCADDAGAVLVTLDDGEPLDPVEFMRAAFPDRRFCDFPSGVAGWQAISADGRIAGSIAVRGSEFVSDRESPWRSLAGSIAVSRVIRLQRRHLFFHAASIGVRGSGILLMGPKASGKTTLSLAMASRGHAFLGDEIAAVRLESMELVAVRRALAVRAGPGADSIKDRLALAGAPTETYPDGSRRQRAQPAALFPSAAPLSMPLSDLILLRGFAAEPSLESFEPRPEHLRHLTPMGATLWGASPARRAFDMLRLISSVRCHELIGGEPEATATLLERLMEA